jgi:hypothetical protein
MYSVPARAKQHNDWGFPQSASNPLSELGPIDQRRIREN